MLGIEEIESGKNCYQFKSNFRFLAKVKETVADPYVVYNVFANGEYDPEMTKGVMMASLHSINGSTEFNDLETEVENLITQEGMQDCHYLATQLLTHAMIGDRKKRELYKVDRRANLVQQITKPFQLMSFKSALSAMVSILVISGISACTTISLCGWPTS